MKPIEELKNTKYLFAGFTFWKFCFCTCKQKNDLNFFSQNSYGKSC